jgi:hypothetical protein
LGFAVCVATQSVEAQADAPLRNIVNIPYVTAYGIGGFGVGDANVSAISIPLSFPVRRFGLDRWGLRLRLTGSFGLYDLGVFEDFELDQIKTVAFLPGVEFQLPLSEHVVLRPFVDVGVGRDIDRRASASLANTGVRSEFVFPWKTAIVGIVPRFEFATSRSSLDALDTDFAGVSVKFDMRHPLWFRLGTAQPDIGAYLKAGTYMKQVNFELRDNDPISIGREYEVGLTTGSCPVLKLWFVPLPRVSVGYRWTDGGVSGVRISLGDRVLRCDRWNFEGM